VDWRKVVRADAVSIQNAVMDPTKPIHVDVAKLLVALGLKASRTDAERQVAAGVNIDGTTSSEKLFRLEGRPARISIRVGKQAKIAVM
jgi:tyrosyl-tRNA synthetase